MVMKYKAATEGCLYGALWLATGHPFTIESWRLFAIGAVAAGIIAFAILARWTLRWWALAVVLGLLILDSTVILGTRQNWGPVALGLMERLFLLGVFLRGLGKNPSSPWTAFLLGAIVGIATFDKLSSVALVAPVALWLLLDDGGNRIRRILAAIGGGFVGGLPLVVVNLKWAGSYGRLFSLGEVHGTHEHSADSFMRVVTGCLKLGSGRGFSDEMVGHGPAPWAECVRSAVDGGRDRRGSRARGRLMADFARRPPRRAARALVDRGRRGALCPPRGHAPPPLADDDPVRPGRGGPRAPGDRRELRRATARSRGSRAVVLVGAVLGLGAARVSSTAEIQQDIREGRVTRKWDPGLNALGRFANDRPSGAGFVAAGWGVATQIFCFSQGRGGHRRRALLELSESGPAGGPARRAWLERGLRRRPRAAAHPARGSGLADLRGCEEPAGLAGGGGRPGARRDRVRAVAEARARAVMLDRRLLDRRL